MDQFCRNMRAWYVQDEEIIAAGVQANIRGADIAQVVQARRKIATIKKSQEGQERRIKE